VYVCVCIHSIAVVYIYFVPKYWIYNMFSIGTYISIGSIDVRLIAKPHRTCNDEIASSNQMTILGALSISLCSFSNDLVSKHQYELS
jgi:hypothetical protein